MAMFGKKKQTSDQEAPGGEAETTVSRPRQPELLARENRAQSIPAGPSRVSAQSSGDSSHTNRPQRPSQAAATGDPEEVSKDGASPERSVSEPKKPSEPVSRPGPAFGAGVGHSPARPATPVSASGPNAGGKRLSVGPGISLSGEIKNCEHLLVEGEIEATLKDCDSLEIAKGGLFKGTAEVQKAIVSGRFEGDLKVLDCLTVKNGGEVQGSVTYADLSIERGGRLRGKMEELKPES